MAVAVLAGVNAVGTASPSRSPSRDPPSLVAVVVIAPAGGASVALALVVRRVETPAAPGGMSTTLVEESSLEGRRAKKSLIQ